MTRVENATVAAWCAGYDGPPFHAMLTDPPYELGFMGKSWDRSGVSFRPETWAALAEHLHDGAFIMAFASARGWHRQAVAMEDAGLIMHPTIFGWGFGSGFPKASRIDTRVDDIAGVERKKQLVPTKKGNLPEQAGMIALGATGFTNISEPVTTLAKAWVSHRYGLQALKPALEPILVFQKPYSGKPVDSITCTGAGALNIDGGRIRISDNDGSNFRINNEQNNGKLCHSEITKDVISERHPLGRWPANLVLCHHSNCQYVGEKKVDGNGHWPKDRAGKGSRIGPVGHTGQDGLDEKFAVETVADWRCVPECPVRRMGEQSGTLKSGVMIAGTLRSTGGGYHGHFPGEETKTDTPADKGTAARFFFNADYMLERLEDADPVVYQAKASRSERNAGLSDDSKCAHPTVKPIKLAQHLATLLLPPKEYAPRRILIPFAGVMSEAIGAMLAGWEEVAAIEQDSEYCKIGRARLDHWASQCGQLDLLADARGSRR
jgi:hypothetical protein